jgi:hypothetical protein
MKRLLAGLVLLPALWVGPTPASADSILALAELGPFRWQFAPSCNVVTLSIVQEGSVFALTGFDDNCGAAHSSAFGSASANPDGSTIAIGLTVVTPNGIAEHFDIVLNGSLSGTWKSTAGKTGTFTFNPSSPAGSPRPAATFSPPSGSTLQGSYGVDFTAAAISDRGTCAFSFGVTLAAAPTPHFLATGAPPTADCPGSPSNPQAGAGHLCVYESQAVNVQSSCILNTSQHTCTPSGTSTPDPFGAAILVFANASGNTRSYGSWAVTVP